MGRPVKRARAELGRQTKQATNVRRADEFALARLQAIATQPRNSRASIYAWSLANIFAARDAQMRGDFRLAVRLAEAMRTDDALFVARVNRLEAQKSINVGITPGGKTAKAHAYALEATALFGEDGLGLAANTVADIEGCLVDHGIAIGFNIWIPREDGTRVDVIHTYWPLEHVRYDENRGLITRIAGGAGEVPIVHGDGNWVVYAKHGDHPWRQDAAVLASAAVWARIALAKRDWSKGSVAHGCAKVIGALPEGVALQDSETGSYTDEATAMLELLRSVASDDTPVGIKPAGATIDFMTNNSTAYQVWEKLVLGAEKAAARIYLGTDGTLGSQGGAPGVDVDALFGVARTRVEGDLRCIERGFYSGVLVPWCAMNFGDSRLAPKREYEIPDVDADAAVESLGKRMLAFHAAVKAERDNGFALTQERVDDLAAQYNVTAPTLAEMGDEEVKTIGEQVADLAAREQAFHAAVKAAKENGFEVTDAWVAQVAREHMVNAPGLPAASAKAPTIALAPTDVVEWITPNEVRAASGLGPQLLPDGTHDPDGYVQIKRIRRSEKQAELDDAARREADALAAEQAAASAPPVEPTPELGTQSEPAPIDTPTDPAA